LHGKFSLTAKAPQRMDDSALYPGAMTGAMTGIMTRGKPSFAKIFRLSVIFSENRFPFFGIMLQGSPMIVPVSP
jgi:hypothetical protein